MRCRTAATERSPARRRRVSSLAKTCSIGLRSSEGGGRNGRWVPTARTARLTPWFSWLPGLSRTLKAARSSARVTATRPLPQFSRASIPGGREKPRDGVPRGLGYAPGRGPGPLARVLHVGGVRRSDVAGGGADGSVPTGCDGRQKLPGHDAAGLRGTAGVVTALRIEFGTADEPPGAIGPVALRDDSFRPAAQARPEVGDGGPEADGALAMGKRAASRREDGREGRNDGGRTGHSRLMDRNVTIRMILRR